MGKRTNLWMVASTVVRSLGDESMLVSGIISADTITEARAIAYDDIMESLPPSEGWAIEVFQVLNITTYVQGMPGVLWAG